MTVEQLLLQIRDDWSTFQSALGDVEEDRIEEAGVVGVWSIKDIVAHVSWFEGEITGVVEARALVGSDWWQLHHDERNRLIYEANMDRGVSEVLADAHSAHVRLVAALGGLPDAALGDPAAFAGMPPEWLPSDIIAQNSYEHYQDHEREIRAWLKR